MADKNTDHTFNINKVKCIILNGFGDHNQFEVTYEDMSSTKLQPNQAAIKVQVCGFNFADIYTRQGLPTGSKQPPKPPFVAGMECAGIVHQIGSDSSDLIVGDHVICYKGAYGGMWSEYVVLDAKYCYKIPKTISWHAAGSILINYCTAYNVLFNMVHAKPGDHIYIDSAGGGVGWAATQLAKTVDEVCVYGGASKHKHEQIKENGVDFVIDYVNEDVAQRLSQLQPAGFDIILDMQSGAKFMEKMALLKHLGKIVHIGGFDMVAGNTISWWQILKTWWSLKNIAITDLILTNASVCGFNLNTLLHNQPKNIPATLNKIIELMLKGQIKPWIHDIYSFDQIHQASQVLSNRQNIGKVLLVP